MLVAKITFRDHGKTSSYDASGISLLRKDLVVVESQFGLQIGRVIDIVEVSDGKSLPKIIRRAHTSDKKRYKKKRDKEKKGRKYCIERIQTRDLPMKLIDVEFLLNGSKAVFYFTAEGRIDFRELVKDLARKFHTRIQMRQIGVRDETKMLGGIGGCGKELCCATFLKKFEPVSIRAAKDQNLALNPAKVSGVCGRLLCCLTYEHQVYREMGKGLPRVGKFVTCAFGTGRVKSVDVLSRKIVLEVEEGVEKVIKPEDIIRTEKTITGEEVSEIMSEDLLKLEDSYHKDEDLASEEFEEEGEKKTPNNKKNST